MDIAPLIDELGRNYKELEKQLSDPSIYGDRKRFESVSREHQRLTNLLSEFNYLEKLKKDLIDNKEMLNIEEDQEFEDCY